MVAAQPDKRWGDGQVIGVIAGYYEAPGIAILIKVLGASPPTNGVYTVRDRMLGEIALKDLLQCSPARCAATLRPSPCWCAGGNDLGNVTNSSGKYNFTALLENSSQVHVLHKSPEYAMGAVSFSPNAAFSPGSQQRWVGLIFSNMVHTSIGLPHLTGEKWSVVGDGVMMAAKCASCNYGGNSTAAIYNVSRSWRAPAAGQPDTTWVVVEAIDAAGAVAWGAVIPAWGGATYTNTTCGGGNHPPSPSPSPSPPQHCRRCGHPDQHPACTADRGNSSCCPGVCCCSYVATCPRTPAPLPRSPSSAPASATTPAPCVGLHQGSLLAEDTWAPLIVVAGRASDFASAEDFTARLSNTPIRLACASGAAQPNCNPHGSVNFDWGQPVTFFLSNGDGLPGDKFCKPPHCNICLPEIDGAAVDIAPSKTYDGPHLSSVLGSNRVTVKYTGDYSMVYDFDDDSITPTHAAAAPVTGRGSAAAAVAF